MMGSKRLSVSPKSHPGSEQSSGDTENNRSLAHSATTLESHPPKMREGGKRKKSLVWVMDILSHSSTHTRPIAWHQPAQNLGAPPCIS